MFSFNAAKFPLFYFILRFFLLILSLCLLPIIFMDKVKDAKNKLKSGLLSLIIMFLILYYVVESVFTFYPETNGKNDTYCAKTWMFYYWNLNKYGFRDVEFTTMSPNKPNIVFVGDSYTEGHGIKDPNDRVSNICRQSFPNFNVYNIGKNGMDINDEIDLLKHIPIHPQIIVLQICSNDWDYLSKSESLLPSRSRYLLAASTSFSFAKYSILFNYLDSKLKNIMEKFFSSKLEDDDISQIYNEFKIDKSASIKSKNSLSVIEYAVDHSKLPQDSIQFHFFKLFRNFNSSLKAMTDSVLFSDYLNKLNELKKYCDDQQTELIVMPYPNMDKFSMTVGNRYTNPYLCSLIKKQNINCVDVYTNLKSAKLSSYTVNSSDNHINTKASKIVANTLILYIRKNILKE